jgi:hypothetical protein
VSATKKQGVFVGRLICLWRYRNVAIEERGPCTKNSSPQHRHMVDKHGHARAEVMHVARANGENHGSRSPRISKPGCMRRSP